jgi:outer membrane protein, multidrug efflux system
VFVVVLGTPAQGQPPLTLPDLVERARGRDLRVVEAQAELRRLGALYDQARWAWFPRLETTLIVGGPTPEAYNDGLGGPPTTEASYLYDLDFGRPGVAVRAESFAFVPLYTFGKLSALRQAGRSGVEAGEGLLERARNEAAFQTAQAYYALTLARQGEATLKETLERLEQAERLVGELLAQKSAQVSRMDTWKVAYYQRQAQARLGQARSGQALALSALKLLVGVAQADELPIADEPLGLPTLELEPLEAYQTRARAQRPELRAMSAGLAAREAEVRIRERAYLPDLGMAGFFRWAWASNATRQRSPFAYDPYHELSSGVALVGRATFDLPIKNAQLEQSRAELSKLQAQSAQLEAAITLEVQRAFGELGEALARAGAQLDAEKQARRWATAAYASFELGTSDTRELTEALLALATASAEKGRALHDVHLGRWALQRVTGAE